MKPGLNGKCQDGDDYDDDDDELYVLDAVSVDDIRMHFRFSIY